MTRHWFGTDGIRGPAGEGPLAAPFLRRLGRALAEQASVEVERPLVLLARDTRESGLRISAALAAGLVAGGAQVVDLGVVPTPALPMAMRARGGVRGVVVSASHNPWVDNGVKVFGAGGLKLTDVQEHALEARVHDLGGEDDDVGHEADAARLDSVDGARAYVEAVLERFTGVDLAGMRIAVDCAHGAATLTAPAVLSALGARVTSLCDAPDGRNINAGCGSTHLGNIAAVVRAGEFDLGLAFDGDADRVLMVDATGRECSGDHMLAFLGGWLAGRGELPNRTVVATIMSNLGLEKVLAADGIALLRTQVGDRYVHAAMRGGGFGLGGEASGHLLFGAEHDFNGDGLYTSLRLLGALRDTGRDLASVIDAVPVIPQVLLNVPVAAKVPLDALPSLGERVVSAESTHGSDVRIVLRYSGTENLARVMVEGVDADVVHGLADELAALWRDAIAARGVEGTRA